MNCSLTIGKHQATICNFTELISEVVITIYKSISRSSVVVDLLATIRMQFSTRTNNAWKRRQLRDASYTCISLKSSSNSMFVEIASSCNSKKQYQRHLYKCSTSDRPVRFTSSNNRDWYSHRETWPARRGIALGPRSYMSFHCHCFDLKPYLQLDIFTLWN